MVTVRCHRGLLEVSLNPVLGGNRLKDRCDDKGSSHERLAST